jgi:hypothetical protein
MGNIKSLNSKSTLKPLAPVYGMIDANAYHSCLATWPPPLAYVWVENAASKNEVLHFIDGKTASDGLLLDDGVKFLNLQTVDMGNALVRLNSRMYNTGKTLNYEDFKKISQIRKDIKELLNGREREDLKNKKEISRLDDLEKEEKNLREAMTDVYRKDIPSLIIATTMDMAFAHIGGYDGELIYQQDKETGKAFYKKHGQDIAYLDDDDALMFRNWEWQISDMETAVASNPSRLLPLFSYDPRRYRLPNQESPGDKGCEAWNQPFARIVGHKDSDSGVKKIWLGFCMNPALGFRPFDEFCEHLPRFYSECEKNNIPILAHCAPGGITTHDAEHYPDDEDERAKKSKNRHEMILKEGLSSCQNNELCTNKYHGEERFAGGEYNDLNRFYMNYGHPRNWIPALEYFPNLRLCLSGFGGNSEWQLADWPNSGTPLPTREWILCIIGLMLKYKNVYADMSGLNIYDKRIRTGLLKLLGLAQGEEDDEFKHLKNKLIFGSGWYFTHLTDTSKGGKGIDGGDAIRHSYGNYCREFKNLFYMADKEGTGKLWECVSIVNPRNFYALSEDKIDNVNNESSNN